MAKKTSWERLKTSQLEMDRKLAEFKKWLKKPSGKGYELHSLKWIGNLQSLEKTSWERLKTSQFEMDRKLAEFKKWLKKT